MFPLKHLAQPALLVSGLLASTAAQGATRTYIVTDFDTIRVEAPIAVAVQTRRGVTARAEGDGDLLERIDLRVSARVLTVRLRPPLFEGRRNSGPAATARLMLTVPALRRAQLSGSGTLAVEGMNAQRAEIVASGSGLLSVSGLVADDLAAMQQGSGTLQMAGGAGNATVQLSGSGLVDAVGLTVSDLDVMAEGAGAVRALATRSAKVAAIGPASVTIEGNPACTVRHAGSGPVQCGGEGF